MSTFYHCTNLSCPMKDLCMRWAGRNDEEKPNYRFFKYTIEKGETFKCQDFIPMIFKNNGQINKNNQD